MASLFGKKLFLVKQFLYQLIGDVPQEKEKSLNDSVNLTTMSTTITKTMTQWHSKLAESQTVNNTLSVKNSWQNINTKMV